MEMYLGLELQIILCNPLQRNGVGVKTTYCCCLATQLCPTLFDPMDHQAPLPVEFFRQEYWRGLPFPSPGDLLDPGMEPLSLVSPALAGGFFTTSATWETSVEAP